MDKDTTQWYASWFDTPYYHILYQDRDHADAQHFMDVLTNYLNLPQGGKILDLACGKGRHSVYLNSLGYDVTGADLSDKSIAHAKQYENDTLHFVVHDMCQPFHEQFDAVFNLFTSFGYFEHEEQNLLALDAIKSNLNENGFGVIDFMNVEHVIENLVAEETKTIQNIDFHIKRYVRDGYIFKSIAFEHLGQDHQFMERVKAFTLNDFEKLFQDSGIYLFDVFGDYKLKKFYKNTSERLIMLFK
ncbi:MAG TPA: class I SAM-dependent methyltransferase [Aquaticitalea sp.]|nr:class I SAM-dependent methyltransferase [Aquaticitalea sp.]